MGHMNKPLFDLDQPGLQAEVDSYKPGNGLIWPVLFPLKYTPKFDLKGIEGEDGIPVSADRVAFNTKAPLKSRKTLVRGVDNSPRFRCQRKRRSWKSVSTKT